MANQLAFNYFKWLISGMPPSACTPEEQDHNFGGIGTGLVGKDHELRQAVKDYESRLDQVTQSLAEYKHRAISAEMKLEEIQANTSVTADLTKEIKEKNLLIGKLRHEAKGQELQKTDETESFSRLWVEFLLTEAAAGEGRPPPTPTSPGQNNSLPGAPTLASPTKGLPPRRLSSFNMSAMASSPNLTLGPPPSRKGKEREKD
ncbi:hypothetical protein BD779DRAFT_1470192 [Infundibulicybe gibba]|nr:hypothetical protein BD779DRAFT_1470192 [Infundibulicybe gibba]